MPNYESNGVLFKNVTAGLNTGGQKINKAPYKYENGNIKNPQLIINAIDIDWNNAEVPGLDDDIISTAMFLSTIGNINETSKQLVRKTQELETGLNNLSDHTSEVEESLGTLAENVDNADRRLQQSINEKISTTEFNERVEEIVNQIGPKETYKHIILTQEEYEALEEYEEDALYMVIDDGVPTPPPTPVPTDPFEDISTNLNVSYVDENGDIQETIYTTDGKISLAPQKSYTLEGTLIGSIEIDTSSLSKVNNDTELILNNVRILSDTDNAILYKIPENAKAQKSLKITLSPNVENYIYCTLTAENTDDQPGAIYSMNNLNIQGAGYLSIKTKSGHGIRADVLNLGGPHIWINSPHDGIHGRDIHIIGGVYSMNGCNDAIGTSNSGRVLFYDGILYTSNLKQNIIDSKNKGLYFSEDLLTSAQLQSCNNMYLLSEQNYKSIFGNITGSIQLLPGQPDFDYDENTTGTPIELDEATDTYIISNTKGNKGKYILATGYINKPIQFDGYGNQNGDNVTLYLNNAFIDTYNNPDLSNGGNVPSVYYSSEGSNIKIMAVQDSINVIRNNYTSTGIDAINFESDCVKSENNLEIELKNNSYLYISSLKADGLDGGETKITDSKGNIIITKCGQRGIKGNAVVIGPDANISLKSNIEQYYTKEFVEEHNRLNPTDQIKYTTFDGICYVKNNCKVFMPEIANGLSDTDKKNSGFADIYGRNGKATRGIIGFTTLELVGVCITGSMCSVSTINMGSAKRLYYNEIIKSNDTIQNPIPLTGSPRILNEVDPTDESKNVVDF